MNNGFVNSAQATRQPVYGIAADREKIVLAQSGAMNTTQFLQRGVEGGDHRGDGQRTVDLQIKSTV